MKLIDHVQIYINACGPVSFEGIEREVRIQHGHALPEAITAAIDSLVAQGCAELYETGDAWGPTAHPYSGFDVETLGKLFPMIAKMFAEAKEHGPESMPAGIGYYRDTMHPKGYRVAIENTDAFCDEAANHGRGALHAAMFLCSLFHPDCRFCAVQSVPLWDHAHRQAWAQACARVAAQS